MNNRLGVSDISSSEMLRNKAGSIIRRRAEEKKKEAGN